jgi:hypothetical protein
MADRILEERLHDTTRHLYYTPYEPTSNCFSMLRGICYARLRT